MFELLACVSIGCLTLGTLGSVWTLLARIPAINEFMNHFFDSVPLGREEVQELNRMEDDSRRYRKRR